MGSLGGVGSLGGWEAWGGGGAWGVGSLGGAGLEGGWVGGGGGGWVGGWVGRGVGRRWGGLGWRVGGEGSWVRRGGVEGREDGGNFANHNPSPSHSFSNSSASIPSLPLHANKTAPSELGRPVESLLAGNPLLSSNLICQWYNN